MSFLRRPWSHDLGSTRTLVTLLRPWIRRFTMIISARRLRTSSKFSGQELEEIHRNIGSLETCLSRFEFLRAQSSYCYEKGADRPVVSV